MPKDDSIENLVLRETTEGIKPYIFTYSLTENDIVSIEQNNRIEDLPEKTRMSTIDGDPTGIHRRNDGTCFIYTWYGPNGEYDGETLYQQTVECPNKEEYIDMTLTDPGNHSGGGGAGPINIQILIPTVPGMGPVDPTYPIVLPGDIDGPPVVTTPVINLLQQRFITGVVTYDPTGEMLLYLNFNKAFKAKIVEFLGSDGSNYEQNAETARDLIDLAMDGNEDAANQILDYLNGEDNSEESIAIIEWMLTYSENEEDVSIDDLVNWFIEDSEGQDGEYDAEFWEDPNLSFPQQDLPTIEEYFDAYPKNVVNGFVYNMESEDVYELVGGSIYSNHLSGNPNYQNACSIRGSRGMNYAGIEIGVVIDENGNQKTEKGGDNKNYILSAIAFNKWMNLTFGPPTHRLTNAEINNDPSVIADFLKGKTGIYTLVTMSPGQAGYSGHVDLMADGKFIGSANANPKGGINFIEIWVLE